MENEEFENLLDKTKSMNVHVFIGKFTSREEAILYTEPCWETEPDDSVSDEEYSAWEDRNPTWQMRSDLDCYLDSDFIETIDGNKFEYLQSVVKDSKGLAVYEDELKQTDSILVLIFDQAIDFQKSEIKSTPKLKYIGYYESTI